MSTGTLPMPPSSVSSRASNGSHGAAHRVVNHNQEHTSFVHLGYLMDTLLRGVVCLRFKLYDDHGPIEYQNVFHCAPLVYPLGIDATIAATHDFLTKDPEHAQRVIDYCVTQHVFTRFASLQGRATSVTEADEIRSFMSTIYAVLEFLESVPGSPQEARLEMPDWSLEIRHKVRTLLFRSVTQFFCDKLFWREGPGIQLPTIPRKFNPTPVYLLMGPPQRYRDLAIPTTEGDPLAIPIMGRDLYSLKSTSDGLMHDLLNLYDFRATVTGPPPAEFEEHSVVSAYAADLSEITAADVLAVNHSGSAETSAGHEGFGSDSSLVAEAQCLPPAAFGAADVFRCRSVWSSPAVRAFVARRMNALPPASTWGDPVLGFAALLAAVQNDIGLASVSLIPFTTTYEDRNRRIINAKGLTVEARETSKWPAPHSFEDIVARLHDAANLEAARSPDFAAADPDPQFVEQLAEGLGVTTEPLAAHASSVKQPHSAKKKAAASASKVSTPASAVKGSLPQQRKTSVTSAASVLGRATSGARRHYAGASDTASKANTVPYEEDDESDPPNVARQLHISAATDPAQSERFAGTGEPALPVAVAELVSLGTMIARRLDRAALPQLPDSVTATLPDVRLSSADRLLLCEALPVPLVQAFLQTASEHTDTLETQMLLFGSVASDERSQALWAAVSTMVLWASAVLHHCESAPSDTVPRLSFSPTRSPIRQPSSIRNPLLCLTPQATPPASPPSSPSNRQSTPRSRLPGERSAPNSPPRRGTTTDTKESEPATIPATGTEAVVTAMDTSRRVLHMASKRWLSIAAEVLEERLATPLSRAASAGHGDLAAALGAPSQRLPSTVARHMQTMPHHVLQTVACLVLTWQEAINAPALRRTAGELDRLCTMQWNALSFALQHRTAAGLRGIELTMHCIGAWCDCVETELSTQPGTAAAATATTPTEQATTTNRTSPRPFGVPGTPNTQAHQNRSPATLSNGVGGSALPHPETAAHHLVIARDATLRAFASFLRPTHLCEATGYLHALQWSLVFGFNQPASMALINAGL